MAHHFLIIYHTHQTINVLYGNIYISLVSPLIYSSFIVSVCVAFTCWQRSLAPGTLNLSFKAQHRPLDFAVKSVYRPQLNTTLIQDPLNYLNLNHKVQYFNKTEYLLHYSQLSQGLFFCTHWTAPPRQHVNATHICEQSPRKSGNLTIC